MGQKRKTEIFEGNEPLHNWRAELEKAGVRVVIVAKGMIGVYHMAAVNFIGNGFQPKILSAVLIDYGGENGFGLNVPATTNAIADDVAAIAGPGRVLASA